MEWTYLTLYNINCFSVDSGNTSESSPMKTDEKVPDLIDSMEHSENFENDVSILTQKINTLSNGGGNSNAGSVRETARYDFT